MNPVLLLAALLPAIILLIRVYKLDKIEKEPRPLLVKLVIVGALNWGGVGLFGFDTVAFLFGGKN